MSPSAPERVLLADICPGEPSAEAVTALVRAPGCGAVVTFVGLVRDHDHGQAVAALSYTAHPSAEDRMRDACELVAGRHEGVRLAAVHRVDDLGVGDVAVVAAAAAPHRAQAFDACRDLIDTVKATVPVWKHQVFDDGHDEWVGAR